MLMSWDGSLYPILQQTCGTDEGTLKGHSQLMHMRIRYHFLADLHVTRQDFG